MTKIVIPSLGTPGLCENTLRAQGFDFETRPVDSGAMYSHMLGDLWREGEGFLMVEADIAPPDGAVEQLLRCRQPWCSAPYLAPILHISLGVLKVTTKALRETQDLPAAWEGQHWASVDSKLIPALLARLPLHTHPPAWVHERFG